MGSSTRVPGHVLIERYSTAAISRRGMREWVCGCGTFIGRQPEMSQERARRAHRQHKEEVKGRG